MTFTGTHVRQRLLAAVEAAVRSVPSLNSVDSSSPELDHPEEGAICDISLVEERSKKDGGNDLGRGVLNRQLTIGLICVAIVPKDMTPEEFEGLVMGDLERALAESEGLAGIADDWFISKTRWSYDQVDDDTVISTATELEVFYKTSTADPGRAL
jgi:hypothetical protein